MEADGITRDDLRAAVASGVIDEVQAVKLQALSDKRMGFRANMIGDDEPFELFRGFSEVFVALGLVLLMVGLVGLGGLIGIHTSGSLAILLVPALLSLAAVWCLALYFTKRRRMTLPSIVLSLGFATGLYYAVASWFSDDIDQQAFNLLLGSFGCLGMLCYYRVFRLPFALLVLSAFLFLLISNLTHKVLGLQTPHNGGFYEMFSAGSSPAFATASVLCGCLTFVAGIYFDLKDPHRVTRYSANAFWLHIIAAPLLVNALVATLLEIPGVVPTVGSIALLLLFALIAIILDRRSFLAAGVIYVGILLFWLIDAAVQNSASIVLTVLILGVFVTVLGAFWAQVRAVVLGKLPEFPGKDRLPPYTKGLQVVE